MKKIAAISMVRNEADIIESFVRHTLTATARLYIVDHMSTDGTRDILQALCKEGLPLEIASFNHAGQEQAEVMTKLMGQAFADGYDFVLPLDADEFLLSDQGQDMDWCRQAIQKVCTTDKVYQLPWITYQTKESYSGKTFLLAQSCMRSTAPDPLGKLLIGCKAWEETHLILSQGNHHVLVKQGAMLQRLIPVSLTGMHLAHFPWRSEEQVSSKMAVGWLSNVAKYSRQTNIANHWRNGFEQLLMNGHIDRPELERAQTAKIPSSCQRITMKYASDMSRSLLRNVLLAAEKIANDYCEQQVCTEKHKVSILMPFLGDQEAFIQSFAAAVAEDYPYVEFIVFSLATEDQKVDPWLNEYLWSQSEQMDKDICYLQNPGEMLWQNIDESADGEYIQWIFPGDIVATHKLLPMLTSLVRHPNIDFVLTNGIEDEQPIKLKQSERLVDLQLEDGFAIGEGNLYRDYLLQHHTLLSGGLSAPLFRRSLMQQCNWMRKALQPGSLPQWSEMWHMVLSDRIIGAMNTPLVHANCQRDMLVVK